MNFLFTLTIILGFASTVFALRCHICRSDKKPDCRDPLNTKEKYAFDCDTANPHDPVERFDPNKPVKVCFKLKFSGGGKQIVVRKCESGESAALIKSECEHLHEHKEGTLYKHRLDNRLKYESCNVCIEDLCNSSTTTGIFAGTVTWFVILVRIMS